MIISEFVSSPVVTSIANRPIPFKFKASRRAFEVLSGFYSEPVLAIPRELGANAWDSHVAAGNTGQMFEVHAPNNLEPWFTVRDFGTGLSPVQMENLYTTFFDSTKTNDNESDGCMGLGSKTPFNYTDNFNVTSYFHGKKHVYNCYLDEAGEPNIILVVTEDTEEPNGLEIKFGINLADINTWIDNITRVYEPFKFRPVVKGATIEYPPREYLYQGKNWGYRKNEGYSQIRECKAYMGNYCYPVSSVAIYSAICKAGNTENIQNVFSNGAFDFFFNIGELVVAPNKEQLQYGDDNITSKNLIDVATTALKEIKELISKSIETPKTRWEALSLYNRYNNYNSPYANIRNIIGDVPVMFDGVKITQGNENVTRVHRESKCNSTNTQLPPFQLHVLEKYDDRCKRTGTYYPQADGKEAIIFYTNSESIKIARIRYYLNTTYADLGFPLPLCYVITDMSVASKTFLAHKAYFGWNDSIVKNIDLLPKPPPVPRAKKVVNTDEVFYADITRYSDGSTNSPYVSWYKKSETFDAAKTYYYVDFMYNTPMWNEREIDSILNDSVKIMVDNLLHDGSKIIYGINRKNVNLLKVGTWINVIALAKKYIKANIATFEDHLYVREYRNELAAMNGLHQKLTRSSAFIKNLTDEDTRKMFQSFVTAFATADKLVNKHFHDDIYLFFKVSAKKHSDVPIDIVAFKKLLKEKYMGIFDMVYGYRDNINDLATIINFIDEKS